MTIFCARNKMISFRALAHAQSLLLLSFKKSARKIILYFLDFFLSHKYVWIKHSYYLGSLYIHTDSSNIIDKSSHFCCIPFLDTLYLHLQLFDRCRTSFFLLLKDIGKSVAFILQVILKGQKSIISFYGCDFPHLGVFQHIC